MHKLLIAFIAVFINQNINATSCRCLENDYQTFSFFKKNTTSFVAWVHNIEVRNDKYIYTVEVIDKLRTSYHGTLTIYGKNPESSNYCVSTLDKKRLYILNPHRTLRGLEISSCEYIVSNGYNPETFALDTMLIKLFANKNFSVDCKYFKGNVINAKREGEWSYHSYERDKRNITSKGKYINDKEEGIWDEYYGNDTNITYHYYGKYLNGKRLGIWTDDQKKYSENFKNGKLIWSVEPALDDSLLLITENKKQMLYTFHTKKLCKEINFKTRKGIAYYIDGKIKETVNINKKGYLASPWFLYNKDGTVEKEKMINEFDEADYFFRNDYPDLKNQK